MASPQPNSPPADEEPGAPRRSSRGWFPLENFCSPAALACFLAVAVIGLAADLWTKHLAWEELIIHKQRTEGRAQILADRHVVIPDVLEFTAVANHGAAMGLGQGKRVLFLGVSAAAVVVLTLFFAHSGRRRLYQITLGMLLAGVLGNLYDRVVWGYVRDMIHVFPGVRWTQLHTALPDVEIFPWVFNLADMFLCIGVAVVMLYVLLAPMEAEEPEPAPSGAT